MFVWGGGAPGCEEEEEEEQLCGNYPCCFGAVSLHANPVANANPAACDGFDPIRRKRSDSCHAVFMVNDAFFKSPIRGSLRAPSNEAAGHLWPTGRSLTCETAETHRNVQQGQLTAGDVSRFVALRGPPHSRPTPSRLPLHPLA